MNELFDLEKDPAKHENLAAKGHVLLRNMLDALK
jgi:hypothetical protein